MIFALLYSTDISELRNVKEIYIFMKSSLVKKEIIDTSGESFRIKDMDCNFVLDNKIIKLKISFQHLKCQSKSHFVHCAYFLSFNQIMTKPNRLMIYLYLLDVNSIWSYFLLRE
jgi:hypothetical protein